jgi:protein-tyrosine kinase
MVEEPLSNISEQYRAIRTNIEFSSADTLLKVIMVTSANMSEGKSTTVSNLAVSFAQQGKKVLLIDADMRKPTVHYIFNQKNSNGLSSILTRHSTLGESILSTHVQGLDIITSGIIPPNPSELLGSNTMKELLEALRTAYDIILIDTPPILPVTDAKVLSAVADGIILVLKSGSTEVEDVKKVKILLESVSTKVIGTVLNQKKVKQSQEYYYSY